MILSVFRETWLHLLRSTKNRLTIVLVLIGVLAYSFLLLPRMDGFNTIDLDKLERTIRSNQGIMLTAIEDERFDTNMFTGKSAYVESRKTFENNQALLAAIENGDVARYRTMHFPLFHYEDMHERYAKNSLYPMKDYEYDMMNYSMRVASYDEADLSFHVLQEKTAWQQLQLFVHKWGPTFAIALTLFIAADVFVLSIRKRTQRIGLPMGWWRYLFIQSLAVMSFVLVLCGTIGLVLFLATGFMFGFGSASWQVLFFNYTEVFTGVEAVFQLVSIRDFLFQTVPFFLMLIYLFIRLSAFFSLVFRQGVVVFVAGLFTLLFERLYFSRTTRDLFGIDISNFPQTYFDFGKVISGQKNFNLNTETVTAEQGLMVLFLTIIAVEVILAVTAYARTRQRFIQ